MRRRTEIKVHLEETLADMLKRMAAKEEVSTSAYARRIFINHLRDLGVLSLDDALRALAA